MLPQNTIGSAGLPGYITDLCRQQSHEEVQQGLHWSASRFLQKKNTVADADLQMVSKADSPQVMLIIKPTVGYHNVLPSPQVTYPA